MSKWTQAQMKKIDDVSASAMGKLRQQQNAQGSSINERWNLARGKDDRWERSTARSSDPDAEEPGSSAAPSVRARAAQLGGPGSAAATKGPPPPPPARIGATSVASAGPPPPPPARQPSTGAEPAVPAYTPVAASGPPAPPARASVGGTAPPNPSRPSAVGAAAASTSLVPKFSEMDATEKEAFFELLDEYFQSRGFFQQQ